MHQTLANVTAFVRAAINELAPATGSSQHLGMVWGAARGGGRAAWTKMVLGSPIPFPWSRNSSPEQGWVALGSHWQGSLVPPNAAQAARLVSSCVLGSAHL